MIPIRGNRGRSSICHNKAEGVDDQKSLGNLSIGGKRRCKQSVGPISVF